MSSLISLHGLQALDNAGKVTPLGKRMTQFPLDPPLSSALLASQTHHCTSEVISIVSLLSASSQVFVEPSPSSDQRSLAQEARAKFRHSSGDHLTLLNLQVAYQELSEGTKEKGATRDWCQRHFVNERALKEAMEIAKQLRVSCERAGLDWKTSCGDNTDLVLKSLLTGLYQNTAILQPDGGYRQTLGHTVSILS
jgi:HrpA-like RNA helicase